MKIAEVQELTVKELEARKREIRHEVLNLRIQQQAGQLERPHMLRTLRRDVARVETVLSAKRSGRAAAPKSAAAPAAEAKAPAKKRVTKPKPKTAK